MAINIQLIQSSGAAVKDLGVPVAEHFITICSPISLKCGKCFQGT